MRPAINLAVYQDLVSFLSAVLPTTGKYIVATKKQDEGIKHHILETKDLVAQTAGKVFRDNQDVDCWFALASYKQGWHKNPKTGKNNLRVQTNIQAIKSLWLDLDVGEGKDYADIKTALTDLLTFVAKLKLPKPYLVQSGRGIHAYFPFKEEVSKRKWQPLADKLKTACFELSLRADPARTADGASIMRLPMTFNNKTTPALPVKILKQGEIVDIKDIEKVLKPFATKKPKTTTITEDNCLEIDFSKYKLPKIPDTHPNLLEACKRVFPPRIITDEFIPDADLIIKGCEQIRNQKDAPEPVWKAMLSVIRCTKNGNEIAHELSKQDKRYTYEETEAKLARLEAEQTSPHTCIYFNNNRQGICNKCPFFGMLNSPIGMHKVKKNERPQTENAHNLSINSEDKDKEERPIIPSSKQHMESIAQNEVENTEKEIDCQASDKLFSQVIDIEVKKEDKEITKEEPKEEVKEESSDIPKYSFKDVRVNEEGCFALVKNRGDYEWIRIYDYPIYPLQAVKGRDPKTGGVKYSYIFRKHNRKGYDDIQIDGSVLLGDGLNKALGDYGFKLKQKEKTAMGNFLIDLLRETEDIIGEVETTDRLGWNEAQTHFLLGNKLYKTDGKVFEMVVSGKAKPYSEITKPVGSLELWKRIANIYNKKGLEWGQLVVASAFASPLMPLGALEKAALLFITGEKGIGKSTALWLGASVYGNPDKMVFNKMDTYNSRIHKLGIYSNISAMFDEMTDMSPKEASDFAYTLTQGRGKDRMSQGGEGLLENTTFWSCLPVMSANDSILSALSQHSADASAQMSRVLEVKATDINNYYTKEELRENELLLRQITQNYGLAGDVYIRYITSHKYEVIKLLSKVEDLVREKANLSSNYRFWTYMITRLIAGATIAKKLGLIDYDVEALLDFLLGLIGKSLEVVNDYVVDRKTLLSSFLSSQIGNRLVVTSEKRPADLGDDNPELGELNDNGYVVQKPPFGREITVRIELDTLSCYVSEDAIKDWCKERKMSVRDFWKAVGDNDAIKTTRATKDTGYGTVFRGSGSVKCRKFTLPRIYFYDGMGFEEAGLTDLIGNEEKELAND